MKIALVSQEYPPETARGGIGTQTAAKAKGLAALGHEVYVVSRSIDSTRYEHRDGLITVIRIPGFEDRIAEMTDIVQWITHSVLVAEELEKLHAKIALDLIDFPEWAAEGYVYLLNRTRWKGVPVVIQLHGPLVMLGKVLNWPEIESAFYKTGTHMEAMCVQLADSVYSSSECSTRWIRSYYDPGKEEIPTIHLGIDTLHFAPQGVAKEQRPTIIFVGKLVRNKGILELTEAAAGLTSKYPGLRLRVIGSGEAKVVDEIKETAARFNAPALLELSGFVHKSDLPDTLSKAHIFAGPSYYEGGPGFVYLEAMACGLPVIACSGSGIDEIVTNGQNGLLVPPQDVQALTDALDKMLGDEAARLQMGRNARDFAIGHADSHDCLMRLEAYYQSVVHAAQQ
jgi:glycosyltransferase involved in cell wall biosynthesis